MKLSQWIKMCGLGLAVSLTGCATTAQTSARSTPTEQLIDVSKLPQGLQRCPNDQINNMTSSPRICFVPSQNAFTVYYDIKFDSNSSDLTSADKKVTDQLIGIIQQYHVPMVELFGYAATKQNDTYAYSRYAIQLSTERAEAVKTYMVQQGLKAENIAITPQGLDNPLVSNTSADRDVNQRVSASFTVSLEADATSSQPVPTQPADAKTVTATSA